MHDDIAQSLKAGFGKSKCVLTFSEVAGERFNVIEGLERLDSNMVSSFFFF